MHVKSGCMFSKSWAHKYSIYMDIDMYCIITSFPFTNIPNIGSPWMLKESTGKNEDGKIGWKKAKTKSKNEKKEGIK